MHKLKNFVTLGVIIFALSSCHDETAEVVTSVSIPEISITDEGIPRFSSSKVLKSALEASNNGVNPFTSVEKPLSFKSLKELRDENNYNISHSKRILDASENDDCEEGSEDELRLSLAEELIFDEDLTNVLDTTLRIIVGNKYFKITKHGTFSCDIRYKDEIKRYIKEYEKEDLIYTGNQRYLLKSNSNISLIDTYGEVEPYEIDLGLKPDPIPWWRLVDEPTYTNTTPFYYNDDENSSFYGLKTCEWKSSSFVNSIIEFLTGSKIASEDVKFDKNHRVRCSLYQVNFGFIARSGFKVKLQKRKKILGIPYWIKTKPQNMVIGIEEFGGDMHYDYQTPFVTALAHFNLTLNNTLTSYIYSGIGKPVFLSDWAKNVFCFFAVPHNTADYNKWLETPDIYNINYDKEVIYQVLKTITKPTFDKLGGIRLKSTDPVVSHMFNQNKNVRYDVRGLQTFPNQCGKSIKFSESGGFHMINGVISGYVPEFFKIQHVKIFGAVKYNNQWKGIRFEYSK